MIPREAFRSELTLEETQASLSAWLSTMGRGHRGVTRGGDGVYADHVYDAYRSMVGYGGGASGGFLIRPEWVQEVFDKARFYGGPFSKCRIIRSEEKARELFYVTYFETSRADGQRYGGLRGFWRGSGSAEVESMTPMQSYASAGIANFEAKRLFIFSIFSRDVVNDAPRFKEFIDTGVYNEFRYNIDRSMIMGSGENEPRGIVNSPATVVIAKEGSQGAGTIVSNNIDKMWAGLYSADRFRPTVSWHASDETILQIDQVASSFNWPPSLYIAAGIQGNPYPLLKSRPLLPTEGVPAIGTTGDLCLVDWSQYAFVYRVMSEVDSGVTVDVGLPPGAVEATRSEHWLFDDDEWAYKWKFRGDGKLMWGKTMTNSNGATVGPAVVLAPR
jgi:HK97 family phage major capsid protein